MLHQPTRSNTCSGLVITSPKPASGLLSGWSPEPDTADRKESEMVHPALRAFADTSPHLASFSQPHRTPTQLQDGGNMQSQAKDPLHALFAPSFFSPTFNGERVHNYFTPSVQPCTPGTHVTDVCACPAHPCVPRVWQST